MTSARGAWLLMLPAAATALLLRPVQDRIDARVRGPVPVVDLLYFPSPSVVDRLALGYQGIVADLYWVRAIQYYGRRDEAAQRAVRYGNLMPMLDIATSLDPDLTDAYVFGASFLSEPEPVGAGRPDQAVALLDKGIARHPLEWRLVFQKGFVHFWFAGDYHRAGQVWLAGSRLATAPPWMEGLAAMALSRSGAVETARAIWERQYQQSDRADLRENARNHLLSMQVDEERWALEFFIRRYRRQRGEFPPALSDLLAAGLVRSLPVDPSGVPYVYDRSTGSVRLSPQSKIRYLKMPYDYERAFKEKLAASFGAE